MSFKKRRAAWLRGRFGEALAAWWLRFKGYRILARDYRTPVGEIDLVARRGRVLAVIEVKARPRIEQAAEAVSVRQRRRIERAAEVFLQRHPGLVGCELRFDALLISPYQRPRHIIGAWRDARGAGINKH